MFSFVGYYKEEILIKPREFFSRVERRRGGDRFYWKIFQYFRKL
jgi:hypothetical protein